MPAGAAGEAPAVEKNNLDTSDAYRVASGATATGITDLGPVDPDDLDRPASRARNDSRINGSMQSLRPYTRWRALPYYAPIVQ
jgi:hypothetical protein